MRAIRVHQQGALDSLVYEEAPDPVPAVGDVLVEVRAAGFTASELFWPIYTDRAGHDRMPIIPAHEFSGEVVALGFGTAGIAVGDEVYGLIDGYRDGGAAELIAVEARDVAPKPASVDYVQAAALPQAGLTSWQALFVHGRLDEGDTVVVHGAAGAVGSMAVQLAHARGVRVTATGRSKVRNLVLGLGADEFVDLEHDRWEDEIAPADMVYDCVGEEILERSVKLVKPGGALISVAGPPPTDRDDIRAIFFIREPNAEQLRELTWLVDAGTIRPQVGAVYPLAEAREAFTAKAAGGIAGRVVLTP
jgi:NADPH:quinone reductase-like Zn-dependent oxidoreductase